VVLATSPGGRVPFRHRGRESIDWLVEAGFMDQRPRDLPDPCMMRAAMPILAPGRGLSLPALARAGVTLVGRPVAVDGQRVGFDDSVAANVAAGDAFAARARAMIDEIIRRRGLNAPPAEPDDHDAPVGLDPPMSFDLRAEEIGSVVWCTGFSVVHRVQRRLLLARPRPGRPRRATTTRRGRRPRARPLVARPALADPPPLQHPCSASPTTPRPSPTRSGPIWRVEDADRC
jgi:hypothetical protein